MNRARDETTNADNRSAELWDDAPVGYVLMDGYGLIQEVNATATELLGVERSWLQGRPLLAYTAEGYRDRMMEHLRHCRSQEGRVTGEIRLQPRGGAPIRVELISRPARARVPPAWHTALVPRPDTSESSEGSGSGTADPDTVQALTRRTEQLRALALRLTQVEQRERRKLAGLLHDHFQGLLVGVWMQVERLRQADPEALAGQVEKILATVNQAIEEARSLSRELFPPAVLEEGLAAAVAWLAKSRREKLHLEVHVEAEDDSDVESVDVRAFLLQAVQELLLNVTKHAEVDEAWVRVRGTEEGVVEVDVEDRGKGMDAEEVAALRAAEGMGLAGLHERLSWLGGGMAVASRPGEGTRITLRVPVVAHSIPEAEGSPTPLAREEPPGSGSA